jgi:hypothetical protein
LPTLICDHLATPLLDVMLEHKPAGDEAHAELCEAILTLVTAERLSDYVPKVLFTNDASTMLNDDAEDDDDEDDEEEEDEDDNDDDDNDNEDKLENENDSDEDDDDERDESRSESSESEKEAKKKTTTTATSGAAPTHLLASPVAGRWLKRLVRNSVAFAPNETPFGELLLATLRGRLAAFAARDGASFLVLTLLSSVDAAAASAAAAELRGASLGVGPGVAALAQWLADHHSKPSKAQKSKKKQ